MKLSKTTISKTKYFLLALLVAFSFSCSTEDGEDGAVGLTGPAGTDGLNGADGNANVQTITYDTSTLDGTRFILTVPAITQDVLNDDVILGYHTASGYDYPMPGGGVAADYVTRPFITVGTYYIDFENWDGNNYTITAGDIDSVKIIIIESTSTTTGRVGNNKQQVYNELNQAGVDINDYYAVCDYYGIVY
ncbi:hypothetical protein [Lacinutrix cladophorae]